MGKAEDFRKAPIKDKRDGRTGQPLPQQLDKKDSLKRGINLPVKNVDGRFQQ
jgi:hypothetical protein